MPKENEYSPEICLEKHTTINKQLDVNIHRLNNHAGRLDNLEQHRSRIEVQIENLMSKLDDLIWILKWFLLGLIASGGSFIIWILKEVIIK